MVVVIVEPESQLATRIRQSKEDFDVQALIRQSSVEALDITIFDRTSWPDEVRMHAVRVGPVIHRLGCNSVPFVHGDRLWSTVTCNDLIQLAIDRECSPDLGGMNASFELLESSW